MATLLGVVLPPEGIILEQPFEGSGGEAAVYLPRDDLPPPLVEAGSQTHTWRTAVSWPMPPCPCGRFPVSSMTMAMDVGRARGRAWITGLQPRDSGGWAAGGCVGNRQW